MYFSIVNSQPVAHNSSFHLVYISKRLILFKQKYESGHQHVYLVFHIFESTGTTLLNLSTTAFDFLKNLPPHSQANDIYFLRIIKKKSKRKGSEREKSQDKAKAIALRRRPSSSQGMGGRWRTLSSFYNRITTSFSYSSKPHFPSFNRSISLAAAATSEIPDPDQFGFVDPELDPCVKIPVKAYFLSTRYLPNTLSFSSSLVSLAPFVIF